MSVYCFDLDGTILFNEACGEVIYESSILLISELKKQNHILVLLTGRMRIDTNSYKHILKYFDYVVFLNGALIYHKNKLIVSKPFPKQKLNEIVTDVKNDFLIFSSINKTHSLYPKEELVSSFPRYSCFYQNYRFIPKKKIYSVSILDYTNDLSHIKDISIYAWKRGGAHILYNANKADIMKIFLHETFISIGDGINDFELLAQSNISITFDDSCQALRDIANYIVLDKKNLFIFYKEKGLV